MHKIVAVGQPKIEASMFKNTSAPEFTSDEKEILKNLIPGGEDLFAADSNKRNNALLLLAKKFYSE